MLARRIGFETPESLDVKVPGHVWIDFETCERSQHVEATAIILVSQSDSFLA